VDLTDLPEISGPLPWQRSVWERLGQQIDHASLPHALLLAGPAGIGKAALAVALARRLLCAAPVDGHNCGACHACALSQSGGHGDLCWLAPEENSRVIRIDQVRGAVEFAGKTAGFGERKVLVLNPADALNANAANALLKLLEEPAAGTFLILVCNRLHGVPATVRSRCQQWRFSLPDANQSLGWLAPAVGGEEPARGLLHAAQGRPLQAAEIHRAGTLEQVEARIAALDALREGRLGPAEVAVLFADQPLDEVLICLATATERWLGASTRAQLGEPARRRGFALLDELHRLRRAFYGGSNPNRALLLDALLISMQRELGAGMYDASIRA
jgi:DNA polymerase-3 subunit delta'